VNACNLEQVGYKTVILVNTCLICKRAVNHGNGGLWLVSVCQVKLLYLLVPFRMF